MAIDDRPPDPDFDAFATLVEIRRFLRERKVQYAIHDWGDDDIVLTFATAGARYEVCIDEEWLFWSVFEGEELQDTDIEKLKARVIEAKS